MDRLRRLVRQDTVLRWARCSECREPFPVTARAMTALTCGPHCASERAMRRKRERNAARRSDPDYQARRRASKIGSAIQKGAGNGQRRSQLIQRVAVQGCCARCHAPPASIKGLTDGNGVGWERCVACGYIQLTPVRREVPPVE